MAGTDIATAISIRFTEASMRRSTAIASDSSASVTGGRSGGSAGSAVRSAGVITASLTPSLEAAGRRSQHRIGG
jgi:hypothetical protein